MSSTNNALGRVRGVVISFLQRKGYGFIKDDSDEQIFVHFSDISGSGYRVLEVGEEVEFTKVAGERGSQAKDVQRLNPPVEIDEVNPNETNRKW